MSIKISIADEKICEKCGSDNLNTNGVCMSCCPHTVVSMSAAFYQDYDTTYSCDICGCGYLQDIVGLKTIRKIYKLIKL